MRKNRAAQRGKQPEEQREQEEKPCGFEEKPCTRKCIHYNTCTRNPYRYGRKEQP